jgi:hypothetical protein
MHKSHSYDIEGLKRDEARLTDTSRSPRNSQAINYLQAELLAIEDLLGRAKSAAANNHHADLVELVDVLKMASFRVPDLDYLKAGAFEKLGFAGDALGSIDLEIELFPGEVKGHRRREELAATAPSQERSYYEVRSPLRLPSWIEIEDRDFILFPDRADQEIYYTIQWLMYKDPSIRTILDIGAGRGDGTSRAIMEAAHFGSPKHVFCIEPDSAKFDVLKRSYGNAASMLNGTSVPIGEYQSDTELALFYKFLPSILNHHTLETVTKWRTRETGYLAENGLSRDGIDDIRRSHGISSFDLVVLDGSLYCGEADLNRVYGARFLVLNYVNSTKNYANFKKLTADDRYLLIVANLKSRCGYAVFVRQ